jgi:hypothetical protein
MKKLYILKFLLVIAFLFSNCSNEKQREPKQKLIQSFDCSKDYPADVYFSHGDVEVVSSPIVSFGGVICRKKTVLKELHYPWARRALNNYPVPKTEQLVSLK